MLEKFFKPKWQHNKPEVRKQALLALQDGSAETLEIYTRVAQQDSDAGVRKLAVNRVLDPAVLRAVADGDGDSDVRELARKRFFRLVAGQDDTGLPLAGRLQWVERESQTDLLEAFARQAKEPELRLAALARVNREALLGDLAIGDGDAQVRLAAAQRLTQPSTMARVAKQSRSRDKKVYALVQGQLDKIKSEQEMPGRMAQEGRGLCGQMETLCKAKDMLATVAQKEHAYTQWQQLLQAWQAPWGEFPADVLQRWNKAVEQYNRRYEEFLAEDGERRQREQHYDSLRQRKRAWCEELEARVAALAAAGGVADPAAEQTLLNERQQAWSAAETLPREEELALGNRFRQAQEQLRQMLRHLGRKQVLAEELAGLQRDGQRLLAGKRHLQEKDIKELRRRLQGCAAEPELLDAQRYEAVRLLLDDLTERRQRQEEKVQQQMARYRQLVVELEQDLAQGVSAAAVNHQRELREIHRHLPPVGKQQLADEGWQGRAHDAAQRLEEIRDWKRWSGTPHKESLVRDMEQLAADVSAGGAGDDIEALAVQVRAAREQWKRLGETDAGLADQLWERFNTACNTAYAPCEAYFKAQADERIVNLQRKQVICDGLEAFIATLADADDWQRIDQMTKTAQQEWRAVGAVNRKESQLLGKRYKTAMDELRARLDQHLQRHADEKVALVERLRQLLEQASGDDAAQLGQALEQAKQIQQQWKRIGRARKERSLWEEFRTINDQLFGRRQAMAEAQKHEQQQIVTARERIIDRIADLAARPAAEIGDLAGQYAQARREWEQAANPGREQLQALNARYRQVCRDVERAQQRAAADAKRRYLDALEDKSALCCRLERALAQAAEPGAADPAATVEAVQQAWQTLATGNDELEVVIQRRFQRAVEAAVGVRGGGAAAAVDGEAHGRLCVRLELLADIATPEEFKAQRMQYQLDHLAEKMRGEARLPPAEFRAVMSAWYALPCPADAAAGEVLRQRFLRARDHYLRHAD